METIGLLGGLEAVVLAGTDFAVMFDARTTPFPHVDCARAHINAILAAAKAGAHADR